MSTQQPYRRWDPEAFVRAWCTSATTREAAKKLGRDVSDVEVYASRLRRAGVKLPSRKARGLDAEGVKHLNRLVDVLTADQVDEDEEEAA